MWIFGYSVVQQFSCLNIQIFEKNWYYCVCVCLIKVGQSTQYDIMCVVLYLFFKYAIIQNWSNFIFLIRKISAFHPSIHSMMGPKVRKGFMPSLPKICSNLRLTSTHRKSTSSRNRWIINSNNKYSINCSWPTDKSCRIVQEAIYSHVLQASMLGMFQPPC